MLYIRVHWYYYHNLRIKLRALKLDWEEFEDTYSPDFTVMEIECDDETKKTILNYMNKNCGTLWGEVA